MAAWPMSNVVLATAFNSWPNTMLAIIKQVFSWQVWIPVRSLGWIDVPIVEAHYLPSSW